MGWKPDGGWYALGGLKLELGLELGVRLPLKLTGRLGCPPTEAFRSPTYEVGRGLGLGETGLLKEGLGETGLAKPEAETGRCLGGGGAAHLSPPPLLDGATTCAGPVLEAPVLVSEATAQPYLQDWGALSLSYWSAPDRA